MRRHQACATHPLLRDEPSRTLGAEPVIADLMSRLRPSNHYARCSPDKGTLKERREGLQNGWNSPRPGAARHPEGAKGRPLRRARGDVSMSAKILGSVIPALTAETMLPTYHIELYMAVIVERWVG